MQKPQTYVEAKALQDELYLAYDKAGEALQKYPKGVLGLTPDEIKFSSAFQVDAIEYNRALTALQTYNTWFVKAYKKERAEERKQKFKV